MTHHSSVRHILYHWGKSSETELPVAISVIRDNCEMVHHRLFLKFQERNFLAVVVDMVQTERRSAIRSHFGYAWKFFHRRKAQLEEQAAITQRRRIEYL